MSPRPLSSPAGTRDLVGADKEAMDRVGSIIGGEFRRHGYVLVQPPVIDNVEPFVDRSGEEIRQRMYTFQDPSGRQLCLRPELTIPTCRLFLDKFHSNLDHQRLCYDGLVFRYDPVGPGRYREFRQVGVEYFGVKPSPAADAETVALAYHSIVACGVSDAHVWLNDVELITAALEELGVPPSTRDYIALRFNAPDALDILRESSTDADQALVASLSEATGDANGSWAAEIAGLRTDGVRQFVRRIMALTNTKELGSRSIEEIAERMVAKLERHAAGRISQHAEACLRELLGVEDRAETATASLKAIAAKYQLQRVATLVERLSQRTACLATLGVPADRLSIRARMKRTLQYYTGFVFEVHASNLGAASELCGGGRYDHLLRSMGASHDVPAVGFAIGVDRVCLATSSRGTNDVSGGVSVRGGVDAILVPAGDDVGADECFRIARLLRDAGWSVEVELEGRRPKNIITKATRRQIPQIVFAGRNELARGGVNIKRLATHAESFVAFTDLARYIAESAAQNDGEVA